MGPKLESAAIGAQRKNNSHPNTGQIQFSAPASDAINGIKRESILGAAIEVCPLGLAIADTRGKIVVNNGELHRMFGYDRNEIIGEAIDILVPTNLQTQHADHRSKFAMDVHTSHSTNV